MGKRRQAQPVCLVCRFFRVGAEIPIVGTCRQSAPDTGYRAWPTVLATDWCGEFDVGPSGEYAGGQVGFSGGEKPKKRKRRKSERAGIGSTVLGVSTQDFDEIIDGDGLPDD